MRRERRRNVRVEWNSPLTIYNVDRHFERPCIVSNFSNHGARITGVRVGTIPDEFKLRITRVEARARACRVTWRSDDSVGVEFTDRVERDEQCGSAGDCTLELSTRRCISRSFAQKAAWLKSDSEQR
jgi:PilZ domain